MTDRVEIVVPPPWPGKATTLVDPVAFTLAWVGAPLIVALLGAWAFIPLFALFFGLPVWLVLGVPFLWRAIRTGTTRPGAFGFLGMRAGLLFALLVVLPGELIFGDGAILTFSYLIFGTIFGGLWALTFGWLYAGPKPDLYLPNQGAVQ